MSAAEHTPHHDPIFELAARELMSQTINVLMRVRGIPHRKDLAERMSPWMSQSTLYSRLARATDWQATELRALSEVLRVPVAAFFVEPEPEVLAPILGLDDAEFVKALVSSVQNWKKMMGPTLHVYPGGAPAAPSSTRPEQQRLRLLHSVE